ncbi:MAG: DUF3305 domain-containing protein [Gammaproteobacteria bacterium]|nr:DUF3305 domain-containing protein [Gammaproteobacteria bacterium]MDH5800406.1 DUF3305 domain-containing protein [Gammaproteobacteria bacterium]
MIYNTTSPQISPESRKAIPVCVVMDYRVSASPWSSGQWEAGAVLVGEHLDSMKHSGNSDNSAGASANGSSNSNADYHSVSGDDSRALRNDSPQSQYLCAGLSISLYTDDADSYYHNLMSETPKVFVICHSETTENTAEINDGPIPPFLVTLSYDEAASYMEVDEQVFSVSMPPELYLLLEQFVLENYIPTQRKKRRRKNWSEAGSE